MKVSQRLHMVDTVDFNRTKNVRHDDVRSYESYLGAFASRAVGYLSIAILAAGSICSAEAQTSVQKTISGRNMPLLNNLGVPYNPGSHWAGKDAGVQNQLLNGLRPGQILTFTNVSGAVSWGEGTHGCAGVAPRVESNIPKLLPVLQFANDQKRVAAAGFPTLNNGNAIRLYDVMNKSIVVPADATALWGSWPDSQYGDNTGGCTFTVTITNPQCSDGIDNDGDGAVDLADFSCQGNPQKNDEANPKTQCQDGIDNDGDGAIDLADFSCQGNRQKNDEFTPKAQCQDGIDNDGDGAIDLADFSCLGDRQRNDESTPRSQCQDGIDNDGDGAIDLNDFSCQGNPQKNDEATPRAQCQDGIDNDGDGAIDLADFSCQGNRQKNDESTPKTQCQDGIDNDGDGAIDLADFSCQGNKQKNDESTPKAQCQDGIDNDGDGAIDLADFSCQGNKQKNDEATPKAQCQDGIDNDGDGAIDLADFSCQGNKQKNDESTPKAQCQDGIDNDKDGLIDMADPGCSSKQDNNEADSTTQCQDGIDNDGDGAVDLADFSCQGNPLKNDESTPKAQCQDGIDNDRDGAIDLKDFSCQGNPQKNDESSPKTECQDGIDNDGDGAIDLKDFSCQGNPQKNDESSPKAQCQDGVDNDGDGAIDLDDFSCQGDSQKNDESSPKAQCQDGIDNDSDGLIDMQDPGCSGAQDNNEGDGTTQCQDRADNDGDGLVDLMDPGCSDPSDNNESDEASKLQLALECVYDNGDNTYTAYFGYDNFVGSEITVKSNDTKTVLNEFSPGAADRGQVTTFATGRAKGAFGVNFDGSPLTWTVRAEGGAVSSVTASKSSPLCKPVEPIAQCIDADITGLRATMGYLNPNGFEVALPVGTLNYFQPAPADKGQPGRFFIGSNLGVFTVPFSGELVWSLPGKSAKVTEATAVCPGGCVETATATIKGELDEVALQMAQLTKDAANFLAKRAKKSMGRTAAKQVATDAQRAKRRADAFVKKANELTLQFPAIIKNCPNTAALCETIDRQATIEALKGLYANQRNATKRIVARGFFNSKGTTKRANVMVEKAKALEAQGLSTVTVLPRFATECK